MPTVLLSKIVNNTCVRRRALFRLYPCFNALLICRHSGVYRQRFDQRYKPPKYGGTDELFFVSHFLPLFSMKKSLTLTGLALGAPALLLSGVALGQGMMFHDVPDDHWARADIEWTYQSNIMTGPGDQTNMFAPERPTNRAELAAVSHRLYNKIMMEMDLVEARVEALEHEDDDTMADNSDDHVAYFTASLMGSQEVPAVTGSGSGTATFRLDDNDLWYNITVTDLTGSIEGAHFHRGGVGVNGPVIEEIIFNGNTATGWWNNLTEAEMDDLMSGNIYVNIHTEENPDGEIRGQIES